MTNKISERDEAMRFPIVRSKEQFLRNFAIFTGGLLENIDWTDMFCAGGAVLACLIWYAQLVFKIRFFSATVADSYISFPT